MDDSVTGSPSSSPVLDAHFSDDNNGYSFFLIPFFLGFATLIFFFWIWKLFSKKGNTVLLLGLSDSGKTIVFSKLIDKDNNVITYMSMKENVYDQYLTDIGKDIKLVDFPGADRLRKQLYEKWFGKELSSVAGIVFVIDSVSFGKKFRDVAEYLYEIIFETKKSVPILVLCNKQDNTLAKTDSAIRSALEREFGLINVSRAKALDSTEGTNKRILTGTGKDFSFDELGKVKIQFATSIAYGVEPELSALVKFIDKL